MYLKMNKKSAFKKIILTSGILVFGLIFLLNQKLYSRDSGYKYFKNYSYKEDYEHQPQNWGIDQDRDGIIYVANQGGLLIFDGVSWRVIDVPNLTVRSLAIDESGTIYIGGNGEIGYFASDAKGFLKYFSLMEHLQEGQKKFSNVWQIHATNEGVYFRTSQFLFRWDSREMRIWEPGNRIYGSYSCKDEFFIYQWKKGLMKMENDTFKLIPGGEELADAAKIYMIVPYDFQKLLIGTRFKGFYLYDGTTLTHFTTEVDDYLKENVVSHGIRLSSGDFAMATRLGGVVIMDPHGGRRYIFDRTSGLQDDNIKYVFQDNQGNLWLCLDKGISKIEYASPFFIYDARSGLPGTVLSLVRHQGDLYAGTTRNLYVLRSHSKTFQPVPGIYGGCWSLLSIKDSMLAATSNGVFQVDNKKNKNRKIIDDQSYVLLPSRHHSSRIWCGTRSGLAALYLENGQWVEEYRINSIKEEIRSIAEDKNKHLWLGLNAGGVIKVDFPEDIDQPVVTRFDTSHNLPEGTIYTTAAAGHVMFGTGKGIFRFDEKKEVFIPDLTLGPKFAGGPDSRPVFRIIEDKNNNIWVHSGSRSFQAIPGPGGTFTIYSQPFRRLPLIQMNAIYPDPDGKSIWFASFDGLIRYDKTVKKNYQQDFPTLLREVQVNEKLIFNGCKVETNETSGSLFPIIEYGDRNLYFEFSAPFFEAETETRYQCLMKGYDKNWTAWTKDNKRNYTNLDSGVYTFRVRAQNVYGTLSREDVFRFKVLPPWYKTWWAFLLYAIAIILVIYGIVRWRSVKLEKEKQRLEQVVKERTTEIKEKNDQLEKQTHTLKDQSEKLKEMDRVKSRFFANISHEFRTPLTLIMSPLDQMLADTEEKGQKKKLKVMLRNSQRLLTLINQLLDLSRFDSGKIRLKAGFQNIVPFLESVLESFQLLALQNKLDLEFHSQEKDISLYFDARKIEEVMYNLLINAFKFTPTGGKIEVSVSIYREDQQDSPEKKEESQGFVKISIRDTGIGISKDQLAHIFDRFYQTENPKGNSLKGIGIGLALTREIVTLHHGKINVHSQEGKGTEFVVQLPLGHKHLKPKEIVITSEAVSNHKNAQEIETLYMDEDEEDEGADTGKGTEKEKKTEEQEKNVILVVEDQADVRRHIRDALQPEYNVVEAGDGKEGIEKAKEIIPDLIVSDIMMPEVDGYELCRVLKNDVNTSHVPVVLLTAKASDESLIRGLETGADDYITKPFNAKILLTRIKNLIELRRQLQLKIQRQKMLLPSEIAVSSVDEKFLKEFQDIIEANISEEKFNVDVLCKKLYMGRSTLFRKVQALTGETPNQFILSYRLERAAQLLKKNFGNVTEVAMEVGFSSPPYFAKCFKEKFHQSPSSFQASESKSK